MATNVSLDAMFFALMRDAGWLIQEQPEPSLKDATRKTDGSGDVEVKLSRAKTSRADARKINGILQVQAGCSYSTR